MSFRRQRDDWDKFLKRHGPELLACDIPDYVIAKKMRFLVFLDHGYDEWGGPITITHSSILAL